MKKEITLDEAMEIILRNYYAHGDGSILCRIKMAADIEDGTYKAEITVKNGEVIGAVIVI